jgi:hypothetical protein
MLPAQVERKSAVSKPTEKLKFLTADGSVVQLQLQHLPLGAVAQLHPQPQLQLHPQPPLQLYLQPQHPRRDKVGVLLAADGAQPQLPPQHLRRDKGGVLLAADGAQAVQVALLVTVNRVDGANLNPEKVLREVAVGESNRTSLVIVPLLLRSATILCCSARLAVN